MNVGIIYALRDGKDGKYVYIGQTINLSNRKAYHKKYPVIQTDNKLVMEVLAIVLEKYLNKIEQLFINIFLAQNCSLVNKKRSIVKPNLEGVLYSELKMQLNYSDAEFCSFLRISPFHWATIKNSQIGKAANQRISKFLREKESQVFLEIIGDKNEKQ